MITWVYTFDELDLAEKECGGDWSKVRRLLGGKGANLAEMTRLGVAVPPGFTITAGACLEYGNLGRKLPEGLWDQVERSLALLEEATGLGFGDSSAPLLVSCRSGAAKSMPGMMDTVLNIGLNDTVVSGLATRTGDEHFALDAYRRLIQMFGSVVLGIRDDVFERILRKHREAEEVDSDVELSTEGLRSVIVQFKAAAPHFPSEPREQLRAAIEAVFRSWDGDRAVAYRRATGISDSLGTGVNVQAMVFGNLATDSATGIAMSRNVTTGEPVLEGDYLAGAQGEDVVAGTRATLPLLTLRDDMPAIYEELAESARSLEQHFRDVQDIEFTIEQGKLWILQTRDAKRTATAAVRIAVELADEGVLTQAEALQRVEPAHVERFLHPQFPAEALAEATILGTGLNVSPGAAVGAVVFEPDRAVELADQGIETILVRPETKPDDVHGMVASRGIVTARGGRTSHAALVARQFGKPAVVGVSDLEIDFTARTMALGEYTIADGDLISIDGSTGTIYAGAVELVEPSIDDAFLERLLGWADEARVLGVRVNADTGPDAAVGRHHGAEGIGLCRTEHMFFAPDRLPIMQRMIMASDELTRREALRDLIPLQRSDFRDLFVAMSGLPVTIRLLDPPLHEFLPGAAEIGARLSDLKLQLSSAATMSEVDTLLSEIESLRVTLARVDALEEENPMLGLRGVRLGIMYPEVIEMQVRAIVEAAIEAREADADPRPAIMVPLVSHVEEFRTQRALIEQTIEKSLAGTGVEIDIEIGTMIETPRAAITADEIGRYADFFSFGTNDLTQMTFGISRDDAEAGFLLQYVEQGILAENPFRVLDASGVGRLIDAATVAGHMANPDLEVGVCGEHGGDPQSIALCHHIGVSYVSCSPLRVPVARIAAAHAALMEPDPDQRDD